LNAPPRPSLVVPELLQGQWTTAVICTFGANLTFFETRIMSQLVQVPLRLVLADRDQLAHTLSEASRTGQRHPLANRAYFAAPIRHRRAAHGKMMLLLGQSEGRLIVGSGNLGYDGYASPGELWHVFAYSDDQPAHLAEFAAARAFIDGLASRELLDPPVVELLQTSWDEATWLPPALAEPASIRSNLDRALIQQLQEFVSEPVTDLITHAPFHDSNCEALQALIAAFDPQRVTLLLTSATSADPDSIRRVLGDGPGRSIELVQVRAEPAAYIHAKWIHLVHRHSETMLTGSANLSGRALLRPLSSGNIEIGVISTGPLGAFSTLYDHLEKQPVADVSSIGLSFHASPEVDDLSAGPAVLWSRLDGNVLAIVFEADLAPGTTLILEDHSGRSLVVISLRYDGKIVAATLDSESAERLAHGGRLSVLIDGSADGPSYTWPYQLGHLRGRLDKAGQKEHLWRIGALPERDAELYELLRELEQTLIIDRQSVWRIAKSAKMRRGEDADGEILKLQDLDWNRVRRDPRYKGYFTRGRSTGAASDRHPGHPCCDRRQARGYRVDGWSA